LSQADRQAVDGALLPGEAERWAGTPSRRLRFSAGDLYTVPFSIMWLSFAIFWEAGVVGSGDGGFFVLWGIPFIAIGLYLLVGRYIYAVYRDRRTVYVITDRRVMSIVRGRAGETVLAFDRDKLNGVFMRPGRNGRGTVSFGGQVSSMDAAGMGTFTSGSRRYGSRRDYRGYDLAFFDVANPQGVAALISTAEDDNYRQPGR
jgi:hypothetical protein